MYRWAPFPFLRITFFLILGILAARFIAIDFFDSQSELALGVALMSGLTLLAAYSLKQKLDYTYIGTAQLLLVSTIGAFNYLNHSEVNQRATLTEMVSRSQAYTAQVNSYPIQRNKYFVYQINTHEFLTDSTTTSASTKIQLYEKRERKSEPTFRYGDKLLISGNPFPIRSPKNPHEFNYAAYMADQNIFFQQFPSINGIQIIARNQGSPITQAVYRLRSHFESTIKTKINGQDEKAVALALLIGIKGYLDPEVRQAFSAAGAMHVLAVSGLHVGIISFLLTWALGLFKKPIIAKVVAPIVSLIVLWAYALLTGFSPSIFRAVTMFSVLIIGKSLSRSTSIYNSLAVSAFFLLLINPTYLFAVGFQLSYLAVIGIVYFYDRIRSIWSPPSWLMDKVWKLTCVSISAQLATAPISIYYFNQFPTYFVVSNLLVIPLSTVIMYLGVAMLAFAKIDTANYIGQGLEWIIWLMNQCVKSIFNLDWSVKDWLYLSNTQTLLIYLAIVMVCCFFYFKKFRYMAMTCLILIALSSEGSASLIRQATKNQIVLYATKENQVIDKVHGLQTDMYSLDSISNLELIKYQIEPNRIASHLPRVTNYSIIKSEAQSVLGFASLNVINRTKFLHVYKNPPFEKIKFRMDTDYLIFSNDSFKSLDEMKDYFHFDHLVIDPSNSWYLKRRIKEQASRSNVPFTDLSENALIISN